MVIARSSVMVGFGQANLIGDLTMTDEMMTLRGRVERPPTPTCCGRMPGFAAERLVGPSGNFAKAQFAVVFGERFTRAMA